MATVTTSIRVDQQLKREADSLFDDLGMSFSTAVNMFLCKAVRDQGIPFWVSRDIPNAETQAAMEEADRIAVDPNFKGYTDIDELFAELES